MPTVGSLDFDRFVFTGTDGIEIVVSDLPAARRSLFLMHYSRFRIQWELFKAEYPDGMLQQAYDDQRLGDDFALERNPMHYPSIRSSVDLLCQMAGIPTEYAGLDTIYGILIYHPDIGMSVLEHIWLKHPKIELEHEGEPLPDNVDQATSLLSQLLSAGHDMNDIRYCLEVVPQRELVTALKLQAQAVEKMQAEKPETSKKSPKRSDTDNLEKLWNSPDIQAEMDKMKTVHLMRTQVQREFGED